MKPFSILALFVCALPAAGQEAASSTPPKITAEAPVPPVLNEQDQRVQQFMAERAKLVEARQAVKEKTKKAKEGKDSPALRSAQAEAKQLETDFLTRNASLLQQIREGEAARKTPPPSDAKKAN